MRFQRLRGALPLERSANRKQDNCGNEETEDYESGNRKSAQEPCFRFGMLRLKHVSND